MSGKIPFLKLVWLHLFPGLLILGLYLLLTPVVNGLGYPSIMSLMIAFLLVIIPFEFGYLVRRAKQETGKSYSFREILVNEAVDKKVLIVFVIVGVVASIVIVSAAQMIDAGVRARFFQWLPDWYQYDREFLSGYAKETLIVTGIVRVIVDGVIIPYTEEYYFRGYLLPRIGAPGVLAPIFAAILFALYHFWQPWNYPSLLLISSILVFPAWYFRNFKISLYIHLMLNLLGSVLFLLMVH